MEQLQQWQGLIGVLLGGALGIGGTFLHSRWKEKVERKSFASALHSEIEALKARYMHVAGNLIKSARTWRDIAFDWPIQGNYFTVFESNGDKLGLLRRDDARKVISFYVNAKGHIDSFKAWSELVKSPHGDVLEGARADYFTKIKSDQEEIEKGAEELLNSLARYWR